MIPFYLITGFLGSGKTTLLKGLLEIYGKSNRIAVIQNEFASTGVDGQELKNESSDFKLVEINNGSVFCACQLSNFVQSVETVVKEYNPDMIFLETSGLADPINIAELLQSDQLSALVSLAQVVTVIDAPNYFRGLNMLIRFKHQIMISDLVLINKTDLVSGTMVTIRDSVNGLNPFAKVYQTSFCRVERKWFQCIGSQIANNYLGKKSEGRPTIAACVLRTHDKISLNSFREFLADAHSYAFRRKGFCNLMEGESVSFHSVFKDITIKELSHYDGPTEIIAFGEGLTPRLLKEKYSFYVNSIKINISL